MTPRGANVEGAGTITMGELGEWLLRAEGERFFVGEARGGGEIMPLLTAMTCGNDGSMTTIHAPSTAAAFSKLALYCARSAGVDLDFFGHLTFNTISLR